AGGAGGGSGDAGGAGAVIDAGLSGTTLRFLTAVATLGDRRVTLTGRPALLARPVGPLVQALRALGCDVAAPGGRPPVLVGPGRPGGGRVSVDASTSSQFVTALLLVGPCAGADIEVTPLRLGAGGYVEMTLALMRRWGAEVERRDDAIVVTAGRAYRGRVEDISGDASAAAHLLALGAATGGAVMVTNLTGAGDQPDLGILEVLTRLGCDCRQEGPDAVVVTGPERLDPIRADLRAMPDQLPTVAVLASLAKGRSVLCGVGVARHHETDRVAAVAAELARVGIFTEAGDDTLVVHGGKPRGPAIVRTYHDHRMAMAFAALGGRVPGIIVDDPGCVTKTYPAFWDDARRLGLAWARMGPAC
ncbi:MAG: 3-phosphoshikimate 1-carboxyvinyltransferase, partial [Acidimicrobiales bacterium]